MNDARRCEQYDEKGRQCGGPATHSVESGQAIEYRCLDCVRAAQELPENEGVEFSVLPDLKPAPRTPRGGRCTRCLRKDCADVKECVRQALLMT